MKWIKDGSLPKTEGEFYCKLRHKNDLPEDRSTGDIVEFFLGTKGWQIGEGWKVIEWLDEKWHDSMGHELSLMLYRAIKILGKKELFENDHKFIDQANQVIIKYSNPLDALRSQSPQTPRDREPEGIDEAYIRKFLIDNRVIRAELQDECTQLLLLFYNHITRK